MHGSWGWTVVFIPVCPSLFSPHPLIVFSASSAVSLQLLVILSLIMFYHPFLHFLLSISTLFSTLLCAPVCVCLFVLVGLGLLFQLLGQSSCLLRTSETSSLNYAGTSLSSSPPFKLCVNTFHFHRAHTHAHMQIFCCAINHLLLT